MNILKIICLYIYNLCLFAVFQEALIDPLKTLKRDVLPRFLTSDYHAKLLKRADIVDGKLPSASGLIIPPPTESKVCLLLLFLLYIYIYLYNYN